ncbi:hypothetical protein C2E31_25755 [Rhodopirellula baltica]|nr:hypothetical protein C2E31_25755 [Rhodopirellula baltica]
MPKSEVVEPGLYTEYSFKPISFIDAAAGFRIAFAHTQADPSDVNATSNFRNTATGPIVEDWMFRTRYFRTS